MKATANIIPGIAYPDIEKVVKTSKNLLFVTLFPQFEINEKKTIKKHDKKTNKSVLYPKFHKFKSCKYFGNLKVQYNICKTGNRKLQKNNKLQKIVAKNDFFPVSLILRLTTNPPLEGE